MTDQMTIFLGAGGALLLIILVSYNGLVKARNTSEESWSGIDTELKRRYDLIPNLVETVRGYAQHEKATLESVTLMRSRAVMSTGTPNHQAKDENALIGSLKAIFAVAENYPDLKADTNFLALQDELANTENRIQAARRLYNANVRDYNNRVQMFPTNILAIMFDFKKREFFEIDELSAKNPTVQLNKTT